MEKLIEYSSGNNIKGYLEVVKIFPDGREEIHFSDKNVITSGMGATLLQAFNAPGTVDLAHFQITEFQLGVSGDATQQVSSTGSLSASLSAASQYGASAGFETHLGTLVESGNLTYNQVFAIIPWAYIKKLTPNRVLYTIRLDENSCNGLTLNEVGLFSKNALQTTPRESKLLCAYRYFSALLKEDGFSVLFRWVIEF